MKISSIFLGSKGLSQSEANHTANIAKELGDRFASRISGVSLFEEKLLEGNREVPYNFVQTEPELEMLCKEEGGLYSLSAWLREGIKAKESILRKIQTCSAEELGFELPVAPKHPEMEATPTLADVMDKLSIAERAEYLKCEAVAAHIGKKIHPGGIFSQWKQKLATTPPVYLVKGAMTDLKVTVKRLYTQDQLDSIFFNLQKEHRAAESRLNYYKAKLNNMLNEEVTRVNSANAITLANFRNELTVHKADSNRITREAEAKRATLLREASELKVIVPHDLEGVLDLVQTYSKK